MQTVMIYEQISADLRLKE